MPAATEIRRASTHRCLSLGLSLVALLSLEGLVACDRGDVREVDLLLHNGVVLTMVEDEGNDSRPNAVAIDSGFIVAIGNESLLERFRGRETLDLEGQTLLPGFIDTHTHIEAVGRRYIDLSETTSIADITERVAERAAELGDGEWITGYGWSEDELAEGRRPTRQDLDRAAPQNPVVLSRAGGHSACANSLALDLASLDRNSPDPERGVLERDASGELNGIVRERHDLLLALVPPASQAELFESLARQLQQQFRFGITSLVQAGETLQGFELWRLVYEQNADLPRASVQIYWPATPEARQAFSQSGIEFRQGDDRLRVGAIKLLVDGGFTGPAAYTIDPYRGTEQDGTSGYRGKLNMTPEELEQSVRQAHQSGWQLGIHAIGDAAIELTVDTLVRVLAEHPRKDHRHYLNHFTVMPPATTMVLMAENGIAISQQPNFTYTLEGRYVANLDGDRLETNNPLRTPMNHGIRLAISSDVLPIGPLVGIEAAVTRQGMSGRVYGAHERLSVLEALAGYTREAAFLTFEENRKGTIEPAKLADLVVLAQDPRTVPPEQISEVPVVMTFVGGKRVYTRSASPP
jgi:predicted amidohydrolase YtcJ